ncbi:hypothetical protein KI387_020359, partial [Taxus chinensis]
LKVQLRFVRNASAKGELCCSNSNNRREEGEMALIWFGLCFQPCCEPNVMSEEELVEKLISSKEMYEDINIEVMQDDRTSPIKPPLLTLRKNLIAKSHNSMSTSHRGMNLQSHYSNSTGGQ